ncbi:MAG: diguanylate cyclase [Gammaproteobacteria bacterium]|nr:diguanylate cyclase [Gammaproteobacteria bacterium]
MKKPQLPAEEAQRLEALESLGVLYSPSEERFDRITKLACKVFDVPIALVSLVAGECQWFKSSQGISAAETPREVSFCGHAILSDDALVVPDASVDQRFADNPLVTGPPGIRFYAGHPIEYQGRKLGTLCLIDDQPRSFSMSDREDLKSLTLWVQNEISVTALSQSQLELLKELGAAKRQNMLDPVTKTWNQAGLDELLFKEFSRTRREQASASIMLIVVDNFGQINQSTDHGSVDLVLMEVAHRVRAAIRPQDVLGRSSEDEFLTYLGDCFINGAAGIGQRVLARITEEPVKAGSYSGEVTISIGIGSAANAEDIDLESLVSLAEEALAAAKDEGGNCVRLRSATALA